MNLRNTAELQATPGAYSQLSKEDDNSSTTFGSPEEAPLLLEANSTPSALQRLSHAAKLMLLSFWYLFVAYILTPLYNLAEWLLRYKYVYVLSIHDFGDDTSVGHRSTRRVQQHRIIAIFASEPEARVAVTEIIASPEYAGRATKIAFPKLEKDDVGVLITSGSQMTGSGDCGRRGGAEVVVLVQKMFVRK